MGEVVLILVALILAPVAILSTGLLIYLASLGILDLLDAIRKRARRRA